MNGCAIINKRINGQGDCFHLKQKKIKFAIRSVKKLPNRNMFRLGSFGALCFEEALYYFCFGFFLGKAESTKFCYLFAGYFSYSGFMYK